ncbi:inositol monophosphatase family protein [Flexibacterium corallicola]|uniref:inositol monophosphatase family protein n=1 Tax=Flexibacterium corallicola TaxID=3037259 RepID=UPI00286EC8C0|nr:inositol monophosphatase family protein [Pseudovibrio sp. M1P-2-3]
MARSALLNVMVQAATKAGRSLARDFGEIENLQVSRKGPGDFVSQADHRAEKIIREELQKARPSYGLLMEESGEIESKDGQHRWIVDPLDGTTNFLHGIPIFAVSIALERAGQIIAAVIYNPVMDELYTAERGNGAFCNDRRLRVAARKDMADCLIGTGIPFIGVGDHARSLKEIRYVMGEVAGIRRCGAAAIDMAWVANGRLDAFWENGLNAWDIAAGILMIREAGGFVSDAEGKDNMLKTGSVITGNEFTHIQLRELLAKAR